MAVKNFTIVHALQDACKNKDIYKFLNAAMIYYCTFSEKANEELINLLDDETSDEEKEKIMYAEAVRIQNKLTMK